MLKLEIYQNNQEDRDRIANYQLADATFTATPQQALAIALDNPDRFPLMVLADDEMVGFFVLIRNEDVQEVGADPATAILIRSLSIAENHRGQGFARRMLQALPQFVQDHFPSATSLTLSVDHGNLPAQKLYEKAGYEDTGRRRYGQYGEQFVLSQELLK
ncbi:MULTISPECIES: GNAT family N-acetyltransferase [Levilactobacillus]|uniref:GNAT family N-acetyltransferase n=1 Tax=Levilactobacillus TaxID=2767886 RepID=UPI00194F6D30|nr:GNAT family N-acetyltransferase [Levilactobacillus sp. 244-2]